MKYEKGKGRSVQRVKGCGYDLISKNDCKERHIEVKGTTKEKLTQRRWLEEKEYRTMNEDSLFYLYAVTNVSSLPKVYEFTKQQIMDRLKGKEIKYIFKLKNNDFH